MRVTPGQAANTRGAYPLTMPQAAASPWLSLQLNSPAGRFHSAGVTRIAAEGRFKGVSPSMTERGRGGEPFSWTRCPRPFPTDKGGAKGRKVTETPHDEILSAAFFRIR